MAERPLSERLAEIMRLPIPGGSADTLAEAAELARRVEAAPVGTVSRYAYIGTLVLVDSDAIVGKRVALVEVPGE